MRAASLAQRLPYWAIEEGETGDSQRATLPYLLLKDGSLVLGLRSGGLDLTGASADTVRALTDQWARALASLPTRGFVQAVFETGLPATAVVADFARRSHAESHPLLRQGRAAQAQRLGAPGRALGTQLTYWVGARACLLPLLKPAKTAAQRRQQRLHFHDACQALYTTALNLVTVLRGQQLLLTWLTAAELEARLARCMAPRLLQGVPATAASAVSAHAAVATPPHDAATLSERLSRQSFAPTPFGLRLVGDNSDGAGDELRLLAMRELPSSTHPSMLHTLLFDGALQTPMRVSITHEKCDQLLQQTQMKQRRKMLFALTGRYFTNHEAQSAYEETEEVLQRMAGQDAQLLRTGLSVCLGPASSRAQNQASRAMVEAAGRRGIVLQALEDLQVTGWLASLPGYGYTLPLQYRLLQHNAAHLTPVFLPHAGDASPDLLFENRQDGLTKLAVRLGQRHDASAVIIGKTGSGKTFLFSLLAKYGCLDLGGHVVIVDNKGPKNSSYRPLCELLGGDYVHLKHEEDVSFNPFPTANEVRNAEGQLDLARLEGLEIILFMMTEDARRALHPDYARNVIRRIVQGLYVDLPANAPAPILSDAVHVCQQLSFASEALRGTAQGVAERLGLWCEDPVRGKLLNRRRTLHTGNAFTVFDFHGFTRDPFLASVLISILSQRIESKMNDLPRDTPKLFAFDEAWAMFDGSAEATTLLNRLYRTARSYGACVYTLTQSHHDITRSAAAQGIMSNVGLVYLMRHQDGHQETAKYFRMNEAQAEQFASLQMVPGSYAETMLLDAHENRTRVLRYAPTAFDLWCDTSRAQDVALREQALRQGGLGLTATIERLAALCPGGAPHQVDRRQAVLEALCLGAGQADKAHVRRAS